MTTIHLVRHGQVENPKGVIYGRLPGFSLSERGRKQAEAAARRLAERDIGAVWASPLERAQETALIIAEPHGLSVKTDDRLTESGTTLEGVTSTVIGFLRSPRHWWKLRNPWKPSWGESFADVRTRVLGAIRDAVDSSDGGEIVIVSHQTPVLVARLSLARRRLPPWLGLSSCETGSVSTLVLDGEEVVSASYFKPPD
jgi:broad specificity phosphatase PhoE